MTPVVVFLFLPSQDFFEMIVCLSSEISHVLQHNIPSAMAMLLLMT
jgi:hypothetical protein